MTKKDNIILLIALSIGAIYVARNELKHRKHKRELISICNEIEDKLLMERKSRDGLVEILTSVAEEMEAIREEIGSVYTHMEVLADNIKAKEE